MTISDVAERQTWRVYRGLGIISKAGVAPAVCAPFRIKQGVGNSGAGYITVFRGPISASLMREKNLSPGVGRGETRTGSSSGSGSGSGAAVGAGDSGSGVGSYTITREAKISLIISSSAAVHGSSGEAEAAGVLPAGMLPAGI